MHTGSTSRVRTVNKHFKKNLWERIACTPLLSGNKAANSGFETQRKRHKKSKIGVSVAPQKGLMSSKIFFKKT